MRKFMDYEQGGDALKKGRQECRSTTETRFADLGNVRWPSSRPLRWDGDGKGGQNVLFKNTVIGFLQTTGWERRGVNSVALVGRKHIPNKNASSNSLILGNV